MMAVKKDKLGDVVLILTTIDISSSKPITNLVEYEEMMGDFYIIAPRSSPAEWIRNISSNPWVDAHVKGKKLHALAEPIFDSPRIAAYFESRLAKGSSIVQSLIRTHGLPKKPTRVQLEALAGRITLFILRPTKR